MFSIQQPGFRLCDRVTRREAIRVGGLSVCGLGLPQLLRSRAALGATGHDSSFGDASFGKAKSVILFWLSGGPPQHETWDLKPDAPEEIRGEFKAIATKTPGLLRPAGATHGNFPGSPNRRDPLIGLRAYYRVAVSRTNKP